jgi:hydrogenase expression/formation protein HypE
VDQVEVCIEQRSLPILQAHPLGREASGIGIVRKGQAGLVTMTTAIGGTRVVDMLSGEQLPRIC